jgi:hypothetical protein
MHTHMRKQAKATQRHMATASLRLDPFPWTYTSQHLPPSSLCAWRKAIIPEDAVKFQCKRWGVYQVGDVVGINMGGTIELGVIVAMFHTGKQSLSIVAWVYAESHAQRLYCQWPRRFEYLISNHFQLIDHDCFIDPALRSHHALLSINYEQGINLYTRQLDRFEDSDNDIVAARASQRPLRFLEFPVKLQMMVFGHIAASEREQHATVDCRVEFRDGQTELDSPLFHGLRNACRQLRELTDDWIVNNKPLVLRIAYSDRLLVSNYLFEPWNSFTTSFLHVQITLNLNAEDPISSMPCQLEWFLLHVAKIWPCLRKSAGTLSALMEFIQTSRALEPLGPILQHLAKITLGSKQHVIEHLEDEFSMTRATMNVAAADEGTGRHIRKRKSPTQDAELVRNSALTKRNIKARGAVSGLSQSNLEKVLTKAMKPPAQLPVLGADELGVVPYTQDGTIQTPVTPAIAEAFILLRDLIKEDACTLDEQNRQSELCRAPVAWMY